MTVYPQEKHACLQAACQRQTTAKFQRQYAQRSGIEGAHALGMCVADLRHARYYGAKKVHMQHLATAHASRPVALGPSCISGTSGSTRSSVPRSISRT